MDPERTSPRNIIDDDPKSRTLPIRHPSGWNQAEARGPKFFKDPTHVEFTDEENGIKYKWNSRAHRKGAMPVAKPTATATWNLKRARPRLFGFDLQDISWWVAQLFLVGSIFWCVNGVMAFCFFSDTSDHAFLCEAVTAFVGGTLFWFGAYLSYVESLNPAQEANFGWEIDHEAKRLVEPHKSRGPLGRQRTHFGRHSHKNQLGKEMSPKSDLSKGGPQWKWYGANWSSFGFVANLIQLYGASVFWIAVLTGLPGVLPASGAQSGGGLPAKSEGLWIGLYWVPQILGAPGFIISGFMFMIEVQSRWWKPKLNSLGWHVGVWNLAGGLGFWFCGIFGVLRETGGSDGTQKWGTAFSTFWGSWFFLLASYIQLFEGLNKR